MNMRKILIGFTLSLVLGLAMGAAFAHPPGGTSSAPARSHFHGPSGICADQQYLYVLVGGKIMQYGLTDATLLKTVDLPEPVPPPSAPPKGAKSGELPPFPPPMGGPHGLWAGNDSLYILAGPLVYQYTASDLKLKATIKLPEPQCPEVGK